MTRYCVQVIRTYEVIAEDQERAEELVLLLEPRNMDTAPIINVTDLDAIELAVAESQANSDCSGEHQ